MSYIVFARKWRPQTFDEVVDQNHIVKTLKNAIQKRHIAHAFLFSGERGVGKTSVARILAKALNCENGPTPDPCNKCKFCEEITKGISTDVIEIDGASNNSVEDIRNLREKIRFAPLNNRYKVYIIDEVHMLSQSAFNALLKTLEEPPAHAIFILATTEPYKIPDTIRSRCQCFDFRRISVNGIVKNLKKIASEEKISISENALLHIAKVSDGSMRDAQSIFERIISYAGEKIEDVDVEEILGLLDRKLLLEFSSALIERDAQKCLRILDKIYNSGYDLTQVYYSLLEHLRNILIIKTSPSISNLMGLSETDINELKKQSEKISIKEIHALFKILQESEDEINRSPFPKLILEMTLLRMIQLRPALPLEEIINKLETMEKRLLEKMNGEIPSIPETLIEEGKKLISDSSFSLPPLEEKDVIWKKLLEQIQKKKASLATMLEQSIPLSITEEEINIGVKPGSLLSEKLKEKDYLDIVARCFETLYKRQVKLKITTLPFFENAEAVPVKTFSQNHELDKARKEAVNNPAVKEILETFSGKIIDVKIYK